MKPVETSRANDTRRLYDTLRSPADLAAANERIDARLDADPQRQQEAADQGDSAGDALLFSLEAKAERDGVAQHSFGDAHCDCPCGRYVADAVQVRRCARPECGVALHYHATDARGALLVVDRETVLARLRMEVAS